MKRSKKILKLAIIIVVLICIVITTLLIINHKKEKVIETTGGDEEIEYKMEAVKDPIKFFSVEDCIRKENNSEFIAEEMFLQEGETIFTYVLYGNEQYYKVTVDIDSLKYSSQRIEQQEYEKAKQGKIKIEQPEKNTNKNFEYMKLTEEDICRIYLERFNAMQIENTEEAYKKIEENYKKERFPNYSDYQEYVEQLKQQLEDTVLSKYSVDYFDDYTQYVLVDIYNRSYMIDATDVTNYKIKLDNYTIKVADYEEDYKQLDDEKKVMSNVYIFLQMINTKDYKHAYDLLNETFRNNNFGTLDEFKDYINTNFFAYNIDLGDNPVSAEGNYYIYKTKIAESTSRVAEVKELTIIMQLKENTDFVMSFNLE